MHTSKVTVLNTITETFNTNTVSTVNVEHIHQTKNSMDTSNKEQHGYIKQGTAWIHQTKNSMDTSNKEQHGYIKQRTA